MTRFRTQLNRSVTHLHPRKSLNYQHIFEYRPVSFYAVDYCTDALCIKDGVKIDPCCGSGSLLLKAEKILGKDAVCNGFFGQEINITTYNLCRINMFLHDVGFDKFNIACEDTLTAPQHWDDEPFELIVSNPPYSIKWEGSDNPLLINDPRFSPAGVLAPKSKADMAFIMHSLSWLAANGTAAIVCFPIATIKKDDALDIGCITEVGGEENAAQRSTRTPGSWL